MMYLLTSGPHSCLLARHACWAVPVGIAYHLFAERQTGSHTEAAAAAAAAAAAPPTHASCCMQMLLVCWLL